MQTSLSASYNHHSPGLSCRHDQDHFGGLHDLDLDRLRSSARTRIRNAAFGIVTTLGKLPSSEATIADFDIATIMDGPTMA